VSLVVAEKGKRSAQTSAKGGVNLGRIGADDGELAVIDL
jgi:hypothetical protein